MILKAFYNLNNSTILWPFLLEAALALDLGKQRTDGNKPQISTVLQSFLDNYTWYRYNYTLYFPCPFLAGFRSGKKSVRCLFIPGSELGDFSALLTLQVSRLTCFTTKWLRALGTATLCPSSQRMLVSHEEHSGISPHLWLLWSPSPSPVSQVSFAGTRNWAKPGLSLSFLGKALSSQWAGDGLVLNIILAVILIKKVAAGSLRRMGARHLKKW